MLPANLQTRDCDLGSYPNFQPAPGRADANRSRRFTLSRLFLWRALVDTVPTGSQSVVLRPPPRADGVGAEFGGHRVKLGGRSPWPGQGPKCWPCPLYCSLSECPQAHSAKEEVPAKRPMERNPLVSSSSCQRDSRDFFRSTPRNSRPTATFPTVCPNPPKL